jgi:DNA invertase Pin-like site-specific DNA recombinase
MKQPEHWIAYMRERSATSPMLDSQEATLRGLIPAGAEVTLVTDFGGSGLAPRPGLEQVLEMVRGGKVTGIACLDVSRLTRSSEILRAVLADLDHHGVALVTQQGQVLSASDRWRLQSEVQSEQTFAKSMSDRTRAAWARRRA